jgi:hypothetical protein
MKLARANYFIVRHGVSGWAGQYRAQPNSNGMRRPASNRISVIRRTAGRLVAHWHVCPQTQRLECSWSVEAAVSDGQLWRYPMQARICKRRRPFMRPSTSNRRLSLSQIRNGVM